MTGLDTNILVRYLTQDDPAQAARVNALMAETEDNDLLRLALHDYRASKADFSDCAVGRQNHSQSCTTTWTMDRGTLDLPHFRQL